jgi:esterase/lipase
MKSPKKPKLKSLPNKPKSKTLKSLEGWKKRAEKVQKENDEKVKAYNKAFSDYTAEKKKLEKLKDSVSEKHTVKFKD